MEEDASRRWKPIEVPGCKVEEEYPLFNRQLHDCCCTLVTRVDDVAMAVQHDLLLIGPARHCWIDFGSTEEAGDVQIAMNGNSVGCKI